MARRTRGRGRGTVSARLRGGDELQRLVQKFPYRAAEIFQAHLESGARTLAVEMARNTQPFGSKEGDEVKFQGTISAEIYRLFSPWRTYQDLHHKRGERFADAWWEIVKSGDDKEARRFLKSMGGSFARLAVRRTVPKAQHRAARTGKKGNIPWRTAQETVVTQDGKLQAFIRRKARTVGAAKAGWMAAAKAASPTGRLGGGKRMAAWANTGRHRKSTGSVIYTGNGIEGRKARVQNHVPWAETALANNAARAVSVARKRLGKALAIALQKEEKKLNRAIAQVRG